MYVYLVLNARPKKVPLSKHEGTTVLQCILNKPDLFKSQDQGHQFKFCTKVFDTFSIIFLKKKIDFIKLFVPETILKALQSYDLPLELIFSCKKNHEKILWLWNKTLLPQEIRVTGTSV